MSTGSLQRRAAFVGSKEFGQVLETTNGLYAKLMADLGLIK